MMLNYIREVNAMKKLTSIEFDLEQLTRYKEFAKHLGISFSSLVKIALQEYISKNGENLQNNK